MPATNPTRPTTALRSPPARRRTIRKGQPKNIRQPIITKKPRKNRVTGEEPPRGENSPLAMESPIAPRISPMISGRIYCTASALCKPKPPAVSRIKQARQNPIFAGFPMSTSATEIIPMIPPAMAMLIRSALKFILPPSSVSLRRLYYS